MSISKEKLRDLFSYNTESGRLSRKGSDKDAGYLKTNGPGKGFRYITIEGKKYLEHRLIWLWHNGLFAKTIIFHKDGIRDNNRIENLREGTKTQSWAVKLDKVKNTMLGVRYIPKTDSWEAVIRFRGKWVRRGPFKTELEAHNRYLLMVENIINL